MVCVTQPWQQYALSAPDTTRRSANRKSILLLPFMTATRWP